MQSLPIERKTASEAATEAVRHLIVEGGLAPGERINEVHLALRLGVSRTPLREALGRLFSEGALVSAPGHGYTVRPLTIEEFEQLYAVRPMLDPEALRLAGLPSAKRLDRLRKLNKALCAARMPEAAIDLDDEWHRELLSDCPNRVLVEIIENMMLRTRRYEIALMRSEESVACAHRSHEAILTALSAGDLAAACRALKHNLENGREPIVAWLQRTIELGRRGK